MRAPIHLFATLGLVTAVAACGGDVAGEAPQSIRLYTSVTQDTVDAVLAVHREVEGAAPVEVFRAPTGELDARIAAERREGGLQADVLWVTDPLSMQAYDEEGLLAAWNPQGAEAVPADLQEESFWGTRLLNVVIVAGSEVEPKPSSWWDLTDPAYKDAVAIPDPGFAGSAFGALAYFALDDQHGLGYLQALADNNAVQLSSVGDVLTGVAEGQYKVGMSLDKSVRDAVGDGAPVELVWPQPGAIAVYSPIAVTTASRFPDAARAFVEVVLSPEGQQAIASTGWQPVRSDVEWPHGGPQVTVDWEQAFGLQQQLLDDYRTIFVG